MKKGKATLRVKVEQDEDAMSPEEWDDPGAFLVTTRNREFESIPKGWDCDRAALIAKGEAKGEDAKLRAFPLYAYIHSGVALSMGRRWPFNCPWDSGQIGFVVVDPREIGGKPEDAAAGIVETWNQYLSGDVWGYVVERVETCDHGHEHSECVDSCWGFYGREYAEEEAQAALRAARKR